MWSCDVVVSGIRGDDLEAGMEYAALVWKFIWGSRVALRTGGLRM